MSNQLWVRYGGVGLIGILLLSGGWWWFRNDAAEVAIAPLPQDPQIQVYFNYSQASRYDEPYRDQTRPGDNLEQVIIDTINRAQGSIDLAIHELNLPGIAQALAAKQRDGVAVRVIVENTYRQSWSQLDQMAVEALSERERAKYNEVMRLADLNQDGTVQVNEALERDALYILEFAAIPIIDDTADGSKGSGLMHHKFLVVDGTTAVVGSANFTLSGIHGDLDDPDSRGNANHLVVIENEAIAQHLTAEFNLMWGDGPGGQEDSLFGLQKPPRSTYNVTLRADSRVTLQFSPVSGDRHPWEQSANGLINNTLNTAQSNIDLALFVFSDQKLSHGLLTQSQQAVAIRALIDPSFIYRSYSEALDMMGIALLNRQCKYDIDNRPWPQPITTVGIPQLAAGDKLHHKFAVMDQQTVITGSQNWSESANRQNDELVLVIHNPTVAAHFSREFDRLYDKASLGGPGWLQTKSQEEQARWGVAIAP
ncbi:MAG: phospholipase D-like domain-containing protein [Leptolyngbyaceae cyanobacterium]